MIAEVIFTGTELLLGQTLNTNAQYLQQALAAQGLDLYRQVTVGDNLVRCAQAIREAAKGADLVFIGGGLGPTEDDVSREALGEAVGLPLVRDEAALTIVRRFFVSRGVSMPDNNFKQALVPRGGLVLDNPIGTAPGVILAHGGKHYFLLPGPPREFARMVDEQVLPYLRRHFAAGVISSRIVKFCGIGESTLDQSLSDLLKSTNPTLAPSAREGQVHLRITAKAADEAAAGRMIAAMEAALRERLGRHIFGTDGDTLAGAVGRLLAGRRVALAETFTGGFLARSLALDAAGSLACGLVLTGDAPPALPPGLRIKPEEDVGEAAARMATAVRAYAASDFGLAVTGAEVGDERSVERFAACIATDDGASCRVKELRLWGNREQAARRAAEAALILLWRSLA
ncbi:MAG: CinA family nicotinamide mononucleotide deamidase-related protein [Peptococcaceae bacterium]|nr:CinA family nicotinamide mononucleotide deamidase-related protein [Peptococcaceae bacterium]